MTWAAKAGGCGRRRIRCILWRRSRRCGAIGYIGYDGAMDTSIAIRTLVQCKGQAHFWAGGGIVADSKLEAEQQEILDKAQAMLSLLGGGQ